MLLLLSSDCMFDLSAKKLFPSGLEFSLTTSAMPASSLVAGSKNVVGAMPANALHGGGNIFGHAHSFFLSSS